MAKANIVKQGVNVSAYLDASFLHMAKGSTLENADGTLKRVPYGLIKKTRSNTTGYESPFGIKFASESDSNRFIWVGPGKAVIYGRQVELLEETMLYDFDTTAESDTLYCTVYINLNLEDLSNETANLALDISGGAFKNFKQDMRQDNLYERTYGLYQAPIARFIYTPGTRRFSNYKQIIPYFEPESRAEVVNLKLISSINNVPIKELGEEIRLVTKRSRFAHMGPRYTLRWFNSDNREALKKMNEFIQRDPSYQTKPDQAPGYSVAVEAEALGKEGNSTTIDETLSGLYTVKRETLCTITGSQLSNALNHDTDRYPLNGGTGDIGIRNLVCMNLYLVGTAFEGRAVIERKHLFSGYGWDDSGMNKSVTLTEYPNIIAKQVIRHTQQDGKFLVAPRLVLYVESHYWHNKESTAPNSAREWTKLAIITEDEYNALQCDEDGLPQASQGTIERYDIKHKYATFSIQNYGSDATGEHNTLKRLNVYYNGLGNETYGALLAGWYRWHPLKDAKGSMKIIIEYIYKGDVKL